ncbi:MAG: FAD-dependent oxidoreductase, partial [Acidimicrobiales bacterium]|nr:FAD-dependent oxidoreductase [Acidimicrobiales bacterium]
TGGDRTAHASTRNMSCCAVLGQGAGIAAAASLHAGVEVDEVPVAHLHAELDRQGVRYT